MDEATSDEPPAFRASDARDRRSRQSERERNLRAAQRARESNRRTRGERVGLRVLIADPVAEPAPEPGTSPPATRQSSRLGSEPPPEPPQQPAAPGEAPPPPAKARPSQLEISKPTPQVDRASLMQAAVERRESMERQASRRRKAAPAGAGPSALILLLGLAAVGGITGGLYRTAPPTVVEGAFGYLTPVTLDQSVAAASLDEARPSGIAIGAVANSSAGSRSSGTRFVWRRIVVMYQASDKGLLDLDAVQALEVGLRSLPSWQRLCSQEVPVALRRFCDPGDSFLAAAYGTSGGASSSEQLQGVSTIIKFDGKSTTQALQLDTLLDYLWRSARSSLMRALPQSSITTTPTAGDLTALRSVFAFYLPEAAAGEKWTSLIEQEVEPAMVAHEGGDLLAVIDVDAVDGVEAREFARQLAPELPLLALGPISAGLATLLVTQRLLLGVVAFFLAIAAPAAAFMGLASHDSRIAGSVSSNLPVSALAVWNILSVAAADLAAACGRAAEVWSIDSRTPWIHPDKERTDRFVRLVWYLMEAFAPQVATGVALCLLSVSIVEVPLLVEFTRYAGAGLLLMVAFALLVYPPTVRYGDIMGRRLSRAAARADSCTQNECCYTIFNVCLAFECGARAPWRRRLAERAAAFCKEALGCWWLRLLAVAVAVAIVVSAAIWPSMPAFRADQPALFVPGFPIRQGRELRQIFSELPMQEASLSEVPTKLHRCRVDAFDAADCSRYACETPRAASASKAAKGCRCYYQHRVGGGCRGAVARLFLPDEDTAPNGTFWPAFWAWARDGLASKGTALNGTAGAKATCKAVDRCVAVPQVGAPLEISDWASGGLYVEQHLRSSFTGDAGAEAPRMEDACDRFLCFCGPEDCRLDDTPQLYGMGWDDFCGSGGCGLPLDSGSADGARRQLAASAPAPAPPPSSTVYVSLVFGLLKPVGPPRRDLNVPLDFDPLFNIQELGAQRSALATCEATHPDLRVISRQCWAIDFRDWLALHGERFPVAPEDFDRKFADFAAGFGLTAAEAQADLASNHTSSAAATPRYWLDDRGRIRGFYATFEVAVPLPGQEQACLQSWTDYVSLRNSLALPGAGEVWLVLPLDFSAEERSALGHATLATSGAGVLLVGIGSLAMTWSCGLMLAAVVVLLLDMTFLALVVVGFGQHAIGVLDVVVLAAFLATLAVPLLRVAQQYAYAQDGPGQQPRSDLRKKFRARSVHTMALQQDSETQDTDSVHERPLWIGAPDAERKARAACAVCRTGEALLAGLLASALAGPALLGTPMEALGQVGACLLGAYAAALPSALGLLPLLLQLGLGPTRTRRKALLVVAHNIARERPLLERARSGALALGLTHGHESEEDGPMAAHILGWPFTQLIEYEEEAEDSPHTSPPGSPRGRPAASLPPPPRRKPKPKPAAMKKRFRKGLLGRSRGPDVAEEDMEGPHVLGLELHGATAMPPFHLAMPVRGNFGGVG